MDIGTEQPGYEIVEAPERTPVEEPSTLPEPTPVEPEKVPAGA